MSISVSPLCERHIGIFCFRQDLRLTDNLGWYELCEMCDEVLPLFILDTSHTTHPDPSEWTTDDKHNLYESLDDLDAELRAYQSRRRPRPRTPPPNRWLTLVRGQPLRVLRKLIHYFEEESDTSCRFTIGWNCPEVHTTSSYNTVAHQFTHQQPHIRVLQNTEDRLTVPSRYLQSPTHSVKRNQSNPQTIWHQLHHIVSRPQRRYAYPPILTLTTDAPVASITMADVADHLAYQRRPSPMYGRARALLQLQPVNLRSTLQRMRTSPPETPHPLAYHLKWGAVSCREVYAAFERVRDMQNDAMCIRYETEMLLCTVCE